MMTRSVAIAVAVAALSAAGLSGPGIASADDQFNGQTYAEAQQAVSRAGMTSRVGAISGDELPTEQCIVTGSQTAEEFGASGSTGAGEVVLNLNCNRTATSSATQSTQQSREAEAGAQQSLEESELDQQATPGEAGSAG